MTMKIVAENTMLSVCAPGWMLAARKKDQLYYNLESEMRRIPLHEELVNGGDLNWHAGKDTSHFEMEHGGHG